MQLFVRCGAPVGTLALDWSAADTVGTVKERLCAKSAQLGPCRYLRLQHGGMSLPDERPLGDIPGLHPCATLTLSCRLRGGGGDGGSTGAESRSCYLEMYLGKKADKVNPEEERLARWTRCHVSGEPLAPPCVADELGNLYNKDALIQRLLDKSLPPALAHITGLRSVTEVKLHSAERSAAGGGSGNGGAGASQASYQPGNDSPFSCPVTGAALNGRAKFVLLRPGGLLVSEKAVKEVPAVVEDLAGRKLAELEITPINPVGEQLDQLRGRLVARQAEKASSKKETKKRAAAAAAAAEAAAGAGAHAGASGSRAAAAAAAADGGGGGAHRGASPTPEEAAAVAAAKRRKLPNGATKDVYSSIFSKPGGAEKETYCCRALSARGMNLT